MEEHPIENLMSTAMNSIKVVDVNTIVGEPIQASNNTVIIPISKLGFGFAAGGSEFKGETIDEYKKKDKDEEVQYRLPFGGGAGARCKYITCCIFNSSIKWSKVVICWSYKLYW